MATRSSVPPEVTTTSQGPPPSPVVSTRIDSSGPLSRPACSSRAVHVAAAHRERPAHERRVLTGRVDCGQVGHIEAGEDVLGLAGADTGRAAVQGLGRPSVVEEDLTGGGSDGLLPAETVGGGEAGHAGVDLAGSGGADVVAVLTTGGGAPAGQGVGEVGAGRHRLGLQGLVGPGERDLSDARAGIPPGTTPR